MINSSAAAAADAVGIREVSEADQAAVRNEIAHYRDMIARGQDCDDRLAELG